MALRTVVTQGLASVGVVTSILTPCQGANKRKLNVTSQVIQHVRKFRLVTSLLLGFELDGETALLSTQVVGLSVVPERLVELNARITWVIPPIGFRLKGVRSPSSQVAAKAPRVVLVTEYCSVRFVA